MALTSIIGASIHAIDHGGMVLTYAEVDAAGLWVWCLGRWPADLLQAKCG